MSLPSVKQREKETLDAGARFVLKSHGTWLHCGYHLTTSIVAPPLLCLPYAFRFLGWVGGVMSLVVGALVTFYSFNLLSHVLEHYSQQGQRLLRFSDVAKEVLGDKWAKFYVGPIQLSLCYGAVIGGILLGGMCAKTIYKLYDSNGSMKLIEFVAAYGVLLMILAQLPSFHSWRHINMISLMLCLSFSAFSAVGSIYIGFKSGKPKDYSVDGNTSGRVFRGLTAIGIIATTYGNAMIPEIQATIAPPVKGKMFKGLCLAYAVGLTTFFPVAISGYWAFGKEADTMIFNSFHDDDGQALVPKWLIMVTILLALVQLLAVMGVYMQPLNELFERLFADPESGEFSLRNVVPRLLTRSLCVIIATVIAGMLPFFGDLVALTGAFGFIPLDFVLPAVLFNVTFKTDRKDFVYWVNSAIAVSFSALALVVTVAAARQIVLDAKTYRLFADV